MWYENGSIVLTREDMPQKAGAFLFLPLSVQREVAEMITDLDADGSVVEEIVLPETRLFGRRIRFDIFAPEKDGA